MSERNEISIKVIGFSGKKKDWVTWEEKFLSKAKRRGYKDLLLGRTEILKSTRKHLSRKSIPTQVTQITCWLRKPSS